MRSLGWNLTTVRRRLVITTAGRKIPEPGVGKGMNVVVADGKTRRLRPYLLGIGDDESDDKLWISDERELTSHPVFGCNYGHPGRCIPPTCQGGVLLLGADQSKQHCPCIFPSGQIPDGQQASCGLLLTHQFLFRRVGRARSRYRRASGLSTSLDWNRANGGEPSPACFTVRDHGARAPSRYYTIRHGSDGRCYHTANLLTFATPAGTALDWSGLFYY
ncbi:hypothetical protein F4803DRAFT_318846 [Xylaria telfairii]|nr:hypothetical protein F4803DRAFT_318846 [Xylaria telfairii]